jgi:hypothetical protein
MTDAITEAEFEHRLPAAYSQGFAHVRVLTITNADDTGPLAIYPRSAEDNSSRANGDEVLSSEAGRTVAAVGFED